MIEASFDPREMDSSGIFVKENFTRGQLLAAHLQKKSQETLAKNSIDRIIRGPQSPIRRKTDRRDLEKSFLAGVDGLQKRCRMSGSPRTKRPRRDREIERKQLIFDSVRR